MSDTLSINDLRLSLIKAETDANNPLLHPLLQIHESPHIEKACQYLVQALRRRRRLLIYETRQEFCQVNERHWLRTQSFDQPLVAELRPVRLHVATALLNNGTKIYPIYVF